MQSFKRKPYPFQFLIATMPRRCNLKENCFNLSSYHVNIFELLIFINGENTYQNQLICDLLPFHFNFQGAMFSNIYC